MNWSNHPKAMAYIVSCVFFLLNISLTDAGWNIQTVDGMFTHVGGHSSLALDSDGNPHISYHSEAHYNLKYARYDGSTWDIVTVDSAGNVGRCTSLILDPSGNPHISYYDDTNRNLKYARRNDFSIWIIETVDDSGTGVGFPSSTIALELVSYGTLTRIFYGDHSNRAHKYARYGGAIWNIETVSSSGDSTPFNSLALTGGGKPCISYYAYGHLYYGYYDGIWNSGLVDGEPEVGLFNCLVLDSSGNPHISYYDETNKYLKYAYYDGTWHIQTVDRTGDVGMHTALALDSSGNPHISYYDETNSDLKYACYDRIWHIETVDSEGTVGWSSSLALDSSGNPHISYYDVSKGDLKYAFYERRPRCLAEALYGEESEEVQVLRDLRDRVLNMTSEGREIIRLYYELSPRIAGMIHQDTVFKQEVKEMIEGVVALVMEPFQ